MGSKIFLKTRSFPFLKACSVQGQAVCVGMRAWCESQLSDSRDCDYEMGLINVLHQKAVVKIIWLTHGLLKCV